MSRTVRYFKLIYIVAGILLSNEAICDTVDRIQITPRLAQSAESKEKLNQRTTRNLEQNLQISDKQLTGFCKRWYHKFFLFRLLNKMQGLLWCQWRVFSIWSFFNFFIECWTNLLCRAFLIGSDCDVIYK